MLSRHRQIQMQIHQLMDACIFAASFWLAYEIRANPLFMDFVGVPDPGPFEGFVWFYLVLIPAGPLILEMQGFYNRPLICQRRSLIVPLFKGCFITTVGLILLLFLFRLTAARGVLVLFGAVSFVMVFAKEEAMRLAYRSKVAQAQYRRRFLLVGTTQELERLRHEMAQRPDSSILIAAELNLDQTPITALVPLMHEHSANGVIASGRHAQFDQLEEIISACEIEGVEAWLIADFFRPLISRTSFDEFHGHPVMVFRSAPETSWQLVVKQVVDLLLALILAVVLSPLLIAVALLIKWTSPGPILFRQLRSGLNGSPFTIYKFRTMVTDAEQRKHELEAMNEMRGPVFKVTHDPRITPIGKWLRRYSIDELPQLINVLRGEMSLVGPRPLPVDEVRRFHDLSHRRRLSVKPGLTCLWQISGRNKIADFADWVRLDLEYIDNWSLWLDLKILFRTVPVVLAGTGAK